MITGAYLLELTKLTEDAAFRNQEKILRENAWLAGLPNECLKISGLNAGRRTKLAKLRQLADRVGKSVAPHAVCEKGCSYCCYIALPMTKEEAQVIGEEIGLKPLNSFSRIDSELPGIETIREQEVASRWGVPCPFLDNSACTIYENRPLACRMHFSLGHSAEMCSPLVASEDSLVPNLDLRTFWLTAVIALNPSGAYADIRDLFPSSRLGSASSMRGEGA